MEETTLDVENTGPCCVLWNHWASPSVSETIPRQKNGSRRSAS